TLTVNQIPTMTVTANNYTVCTGSPVILTASGPVSYVWSSNAGSVTTATASVNPTSNTTYTATGTTTGCSIKKTIMVNTFALPPVTAMASSDTICNGASATLTGGGASTYTWSSNAGSVTTNTTSITPATTDTYTITGTDVHTCVNTATVTVVVRTCVGIKQNPAVGLLNVYPIPATNTLFIDAEKNARIKMFDITGQLVLEQSISQGENEINIGNLPAGAYDLTVNTGGQTTYVKVMINK
ncbi:MAG TPA: T9SS type A sorting domain-containing protein, partial [Bacteroidia bacterium]|nr:T9SS type A sorting domain-containing protein [Bacteroidia bacterium]